VPDTPAEGTIHSGSRVVGVGIEHLRAFLVVAEELSFTQAATRLYIGASRLSRRIRELESSVGAPLFARTTRKVALTDAGVTLLPRARDIVDRFDALGWVVREHRLRNGSIEVGFGPGVHAADRRAVAEAARRASPTCRLVPHSGANDELAADLRAGRIELALLHSPELDGFATWPVREEEFGVAFAASSPLASLERVPLRSLRGMRYVTLGERPTRTVETTIIPALRAAGVKEHLSLNLKFWSDVPAYLTTGECFAVVPIGRANPLRRALEDPDVVLRPLDGLGVRFPTVAAWLAEREAPDTVLAQIVHELRTVFPKRS